MGTLREDYDKTYEETTIPAPKKEPVVSSWLTNSSELLQILYFPDQKNIFGIYVKEFAEIFTKIVYNTAQIASFSEYLWVSDFWLRIFQFVK